MNEPRAVQTDLPINPRKVRRFSEPDLIEPPNPRPGMSRWMALFIVAGLLIAVAFVVKEFYFSKPKKGILPTGDLVAVERGPLSIGVTSSGSIRSGDAIVVKNKVEGRTSILWIIDEGTQVKEGETLMVLDSSYLQDEKLEQEIELETSRAAFINAEQMLEITRGEGQAKIEAVTVEYRLSLLDLEKYAGISTDEYVRLRENAQDLTSVAKGSLLQELNELAGKAARNAGDRDRFQALLEQLEGSYKQEMRKALNSIIIADSEVRRAKDRHEGSEELHRLSYITSTELEADALDYQRKMLDKEVAAGELELLAKFTYKRTIEELVSAVRQAEFSLDKAEHEAEANVVDSQANMNARRERLVRDEQNLKFINAQLDACEIKAPRDGMVVFGTTGNDRDREEPLAEGVEVRERQDLFQLPTTDNLVADIKIHESALTKVTVGMPVRITTDALANNRFLGRVQKIGMLPDARSRWLNPDMKVYNTVVEIIEGEELLRTGMSCKAEIVIEEFEEALYIPMQSVVRVNDRPTVYIPLEDGSLAPHPIEVGLDDNRVIQVISGLEEGRLISLIPPLEEGRVVVTPIEEDVSENKNDESPDGD